MLELMVVIAIMSIMATVSVNSYRVMRRGMEESSIVRNVSQFVRLSYQRSKIDLVPVNVYFWNETRSVQSDDSDLVVVGHAVAIRRHGRITSFSDGILVDEFGDLDVYGATDDEGNLDPDDTQAYQNDDGMFLYQINGNEQTFQRSLVSRTCAPVTTENIRMMSDLDWAPNGTGGNKISAYGFYLKDPGGITWKKGDAYGLEFGDLELPNMYIFGSSYSSSVAAPLRQVKAFNFNPLGTEDGGGSTVQISAIHMTSGSYEVRSIGDSIAPNRKQSQQAN